MINLSDLSWTATFEEFQDAVEANATEGLSATCKVIDGRLVASLGTTDKDPKPNLKLLADLLRSNAPLCDDVRCWLADMLDPNVRSDVRLTAVRRQGSRRKSSVIYWEAVTHFRDISEKGNRKRAIHATAEKFGISKSTLEEAISRLTAALDENGRISAEAFAPE